MKQGLARSTVAKQLRQAGVKPEHRRAGYLSAQVPYGWRMVGGRLILHAAEQKVIESIFDWQKEGHSLHKIAKRLTLSGVRTKNGGQWQARTISRILERALCS